MKYLRLLAAVAVAAPGVLAIPEWAQCGGIGWSGSGNCDSGLTCTHLNDYYFQCLRGSAPPAPTTSAPAPPTTVAPPPTTVAPPPATSVPTSSGPAPTAPASCAAIPASVSFSNAALPDPFQPIAGGARISTKAQWTCQRNEISQLLQRYELGTMPPKPQSVTASFSGGTLTINVSDQGKSISFAVKITTPSGSGPFPAIIAYGGPSIPIPNTIGVITFNNDDMAAQQSGSSRGQGKFYQLYGSGHSAGAMTAWAWGVQRIIDALEITPAANVDLTRIGVTGCSRNGKGALVAGAFDERIALTIPQESGSGGSASWRLSNFQQSQGQNVQTAPEIVQENVWFSPNFNSWVNQVNSMPVDHHQLTAMVAPRGLYVIENTSMEWLGALSTYGCQRASKLVYQALGASANMGYSQVGGHDHCAFPSAQQTELTAFLNTFLLKGSGTTDIFRTDTTYSNFDQTRWIPWSVPTLS
ncbi:AB hydrolase superfamily protein [Pleurotus pulmonarius]